MTDKNSRRDLLKRLRWLVTPYCILGRSVRRGSPKTGSGELSSLDPGRGVGRSRKEGKGNIVLAIDLTPKLLLVTSKEEKGKFFLSLSQFLPNSVSLHLQTSCIPGLVPEEVGDAGAVRHKRTAARPSREMTSRQGERGLGRTRHGSYIVPGTKKSRFSAVLRSRIT